MYEVVKILSTVADNAGSLLGDTRVFSTLPRLAPTFGRAYTVAVLAPTVPFSALGAPCFFVNPVDHLIYVKVSKTQTICLMKGFRKRVDDTSRVIPLAFSCFAGNVRDEVLTREDTADLGYPDRQGFEIAYLSNDKSWITCNTNLRARHKVYVDETSPGRRESYPTTDFESLGLLSLFMYGETRHDSVFLKTGKHIAKSMAGERKIRLDGELVTLLGGKIVLHAPTVLTDENPTQAEPVFISADD